MEKRNTGIEEPKPTPSTDKKVHACSCGEKHALDSQCTNAISRPVSNRDAILPTSSLIQSSHTILSGPSVMRAKKETFICSPKQSTASKLPVQIEPSKASGVKAKKKSSSKKSMVSKVPSRNSDGSQKLRLIKPKPVLPNILVVVPITTYITPLTLQNSALAENNLNLNLPESPVNAETSLSHETPNAEPSKNNLILRRSELPVASKDSLLDSNLGSSQEPKISEVLKNPKFSRAPAVNQVNQRETVIKSTGRVIEHSSEKVLKQNFVKDPKNQQQESSKVETMEDNLITRSVAIRACEKERLREMLNPEFFSVLHPSIPRTALALNSGFFELEYRPENPPHSSANQQQPAFSNDISAPQPSTSLLSKISDSDASDID